MSPLIVITGPPGAGKSTVAEELVASFEPGALVSGDAFFGFLRGGAIAPWTEAARSQNETVTRAAAAAAGLMAAGGLTTVFDGIVGPWMLPTFLAGAEVSSVEYVVLLPSVETCVARVASRVDHGFSDEAATRKMHAEFAGASVEARHVLANPPGDAAAVAALVAGALTARRLHYP